MITSVINSQKKRSRQKLLTSPFTNFLPTLHAAKKSETEPSQNEQASGQNERESNRNERATQNGQSDALKNCQRSAASAKRNLAKALGTNNDAEREALITSALAGVKSICDDLDVISESPTKKARTEEGGKESEPESEMSD